MESDYDAWVTRGPPDSKCPKCGSSEIGFDEELNEWNCPCGYNEKVRGEEGETHG